MCLGHGFRYKYKEHKDKFTFVIIRKVSPTSALAVRYNGKDRMHTTLAMLEEIEGTILIN